MKHNSVITKLRPILKIVLGLFFVVAIGNAFKNLLDPEIGLSVHKEIGAEFPSFTLCPQNELTANVTSFSEFLPETSQVMDLFNISIELGFHEANHLSVELSNVKLVEKHFKVQSMMRETFIVKDIAKFLACRCVTVDPPKMSILNGKYRSRPMIKIQASAKGQEVVEIFNVYYHGYKQSTISENYWDYSNMQYFTIGGTNIYNVKLVELSMERIHKINRRDHICDSANSVLLESCVENFVESTLKCGLPWSTHQSTYEKCQTRQEFDDFKALMLNLPYKGVCKIKNCNRINTKFRVLAELPGHNDNLTTVLLYINDNETTVTKEVELYGISNFVSDFGGFLGLLLGTSILSFFDAIDKFASSCKCYKNPKIQIKE